MQRSFFPRGVGLVSLFGLLVLLGVSVHAQALSENQVFFKNEGASVSRFELINVPVSFQVGQQNVSGLSSILLSNAQGSIPTQGVATSYYKDGSVRTAILHALPFLQPGEEKIYTIASGASPGFVTPPTLQAFVDQGSIRAVSKDLLGGEYEAVFRVKDAQLIENGSVVKIWKFVQKHRPVAGCNAMTTDPAGCLPYLFTSVFYVTAVSGNARVKVDHFVDNWGDLAEDTPSYAEGQTGFVYYDNTRLEIDTGSQAHSLYVVDAAAHTPSYLETVSPSKTTYWIMPSNGQATLSAPPYNDGVGSTNYIAAGQGLLTRMTISLGFPLSFDVFEESQVHSGQSLARWNGISGYFFEDVPNPDAIDPGYDFGPDGQNYLNFTKNTVSAPANGHRWGVYDRGYKDQQTPGFYWYYRQEPIPVVRYLLSCYTRCNRYYADALRFFTYSSAEVTDHAIGFDPIDHPNNNGDQYGAPAFEVNVPGGLVNHVVYSDSDLLGLENRNTARPGEPYRKDAQGNSYTDSMPAYSQTYSHNWTNRDAAHMSLGPEFYRWMLTGDYMSRELGLNQINRVAAMVQFYNANLSTLGFTHTTRTRGRAAKNISLAYSVTGLSEYRTFGNEIVNLIDFRRDKHAVGGNGINPVTGEGFPVKNFGGKPDCSQNGNSEIWVPGNACKTQLFEEMQVFHGLATLYMDTITDAGTIAKMKAAMGDALDFLYTYGYKSPSQVKNGKPGGNGVTIFEGTGGHATFNLVVGNFSEEGLANPGTFRAYTQFNYEQDPQLYQGWCQALKATEQMGGTSVNPNFNTYKAEFTDLFKKAYAVPGFNDYGRAHGIMFVDPTYSYDTGAGIKDEEMCGLTYAMNLPNAREVNSCTDLDNDGFTDCVLDCQNSNANVRPNSPESCFNGVDDNCNGVKDCNERDCAWSYVSATNSYTLNLACVNQSNAQGAGFCGDGVVSTNTQGVAEQCDFSILNGQSNNTCPSFTCISPLVSSTSGCVCASSAPLSLASISPSTAQLGSPTTLTLTGTGFQSGAIVSIDTLTHLTPTSIVPGAIAVSLSGAQSTALGLGSHAVRVQNPTGPPSNSVGLTLSNTGTSPGAIVMTLTIGPTPANATFSWSTPPGTAPIQYTIRGVLSSNPVATDLSISPAEFDNAGVAWIVNQSGVGSPYSVVGSAGTGYCFVVRASNALGYSQSNTLCFTVPSDGSGSTCGDGIITSPETCDVLGNVGCGGAAPVCNGLCSGCGTGNSFSSGGAGSGGSGGGGGGGGSSGPAVCGDGIKAASEFCETNGNQGCGPGLACNNCQTCRPASPESCTAGIELCDGIDNDCDGQADEGCAAFLPLTCSNGVRDAGETGVDCGGTCPACLTEEIIPNSIFAFAAALASPFLILLGFFGDLLRLFFPQ